jgi:hypothetical protein
LVIIQLRGTGSIQRIKRLFWFWPLLMLFMDVNEEPRIDHSLYTAISILKRSTTWDGSGGLVNYWSGTIWRRKTNTVFHERFCLFSYSNLLLPLCIMRQTAAQARLY